MIIQATKYGQYDARREPRKSIFVLATIYFGTGSAPVIVRDMSSRGALLDGPLVPQPGTKVRLCRGSLNIAGEIVWSNEGRAGLLSEATVSVDDWLPGGRTPAPQQRIDVIVQEVKAGRTIGAAPSSGPVTIEHSQITALELTSLRQAIESLADDLADDPAVLERHASKLQTLDLAAQTLTKLAAGL